MLIIAQLSQLIVPFPQDPSSSTPSPRSRAPSWIAEIQSRFVALTTGSSIAVVHERTVSSRPWPLESTRT